MVNRGYFYQVCLDNADNGINGNEMPLITNWIVCTVVSVEVNISI